MHGELRPLTSLRFIAAFYVFLFHVDTHFGGLPVGWVGKAIIRHGAVGMALFFVLSGFVLAYTYTSRPERLGTYTRRRMARIVPIYVLAALATLPWFYRFVPANAGRTWEALTAIVGLNVL